LEVLIPRNSTGQQIYKLAQTQAWRIEFLYRNIREYCMGLLHGGGQKDEFVQPGELVLLTTPNIREYFYTQIRLYSSRLPY
jgi:hypothetical protein